MLIAKNSKYKFEEIAFAESSVNMQPKPKQENIKAYNPGVTIDDHPTKYSWKEDVQQITAIRKAHFNSVLSKIKSDLGIIKKVYFNHKELNSWLLSNKDYSKDENENEATNYLIKKGRIKS